MIVAVVGLGYVGLPLAIRAAEVGHCVVGIEVDKTKVAALAGGHSYIEDVTDDRLERVLASGKFVPMLAEELEAFDIGVISVPTPLRNGEPDLAYVESAGRVLGRCLRPGNAVSLESTTYPGTTDTLLSHVLERESGLIAGLDFHLGFSPERIDPGNKVFTLINTPKIVSGTTPEGLAVIKGFYDSIVERTVPVSSPRVAEMTKLYENIQAYVMIGLVNELSEICNGLDIDVWEVIDAAMTKGHSVARWTPGPGVGGHCLPIDPMYLAWQSRTHLGKPFRFAELAHEVNRNRPRYVAKRARQLLADKGMAIEGTPVLVLGVAYKPDVADVRESPAIDLVQVLKELGAQVTVVDPHVTGWTMSPTLTVEELASCLPEFPLSIVVTGHAAFDYDKIGKLSPLVLDCRNMMAVADNVTAL